MQTQTVVTTLLHGTLPFSNYQSRAKTTLCPGKSSTARARPVTPLRQVHWPLAFVIIAISADRISYPLTQMAMRGGDLPPFCPAALWIFSSGFFPWPPGKWNQHWQPNRRRGWPRMDQRGWGMAVPGTLISGTDIGFARCYSNVNFPPQRDPPRSSSKNLG